MLNFAILVLPIVIALEESVPVDAVQVNAVIIQIAVKDMFVMKGLA